MKYRKKPVVIEAFQWAPNTPSSTAPDWFFEACFARTCYPDDDGTLVIQTLEGRMRGDVGDFIIRGVKGEIYPCKPDIFAATYELAE